MFGKDPQMTSLALMGFGNTLSALGRGQQPNNGAIAATMAQGRQRADRAKAMQESGIMDLFTPEQRAALMIMEPGPATQIIANKMFPGPQQRQIFKGADGYNYYLDTLERVLPDVEVPQAPGYQTMTGAELGLSGDQANQTFNVSPDGKVTPIGGGGDTINVNTGPNGTDFGEPGAGLVWQRDQNGNIQLDERGAPIAIAYQGGTAWRAEQERLAAEQAAGQSRASAAETDATRSSVVTSTTKRIRDMIQGGGPLDLPEVGIFGSAISGVNQEAADVSGYIETLKGMVVFDRLVALKEASANGSSGLGQVTEKEIGLLSAQLGALDQRMSPAAILETLDTIDDVFGKLSPEAEAFVTGRSDALPTGSGSRVPDFSQMTDEQLEAWIARNGQ